MIAARSPIVRLAIQTATPLAVVVAIYLLFAGHNRPGGGFAAGLVVGAIIALRVIAGLQRPVGAVPLLALGGVVAGAVAGRCSAGAASLPLLGFTLLPSSNPCMRCRT